MSLLKLWNSALIIEMQEAARNSLKTQLEQLQVGWIVTVDSVHRALQTVRSRTFDIILCGFDLKDGRTGQQFLEQGRVEGILPHSKVFMMVTAHSIEEDVMAVAEWIPDDFIVRPFTPKTLYERLLEATTKKVELKDILLELDEQKLSWVIQRCQEYLWTGRLRHRRYVQRIEAETYLRMEENAKAAKCYEQILGERPAPWAEFGLWKALLRLGERDRARRLFEHVASHERHVESLDELAQMFEHDGDDTSAQNALERAVIKSPHRVDRLHRLGDIAARNGDFATAEKAYTKASTHGAGSCFHTPGVYFRLAEFALAGGNIKKAEEALGALRKNFPDDLGAKFCLALWDSDSYRKQGKTEEALASLEKAEQIYTQNKDVSYPKSAVLRFSVECLFYGKDSVGEPILRNAYYNTNRRDTVREMALSYAPDGATKTKLKMLFEEFEEDLRNLHKKWLEMIQKGDWEGALDAAVRASSDQVNNPEAQLMSAQILLAYLDKHGWEDDRFVLARKCLERVKWLDKNHSRIPTIEMLADRVKKKYGIRAEPRISGYEPPKKEVNHSQAKSEPLDGNWAEESIDADLLAGIVLK